MFGYSAGLSVSFQVLPIPECSDDVSNNEPEYTVEDNDAASEDSCRDWSRSVVVMGECNGNGVDEVGKMIDQLPSCTSPAPKRSFVSQSETCSRLLLGV
jgi:hypothetical protein